jgi:hypothetical protein
MAWAGTRPSRNAFNTRPLSAARPADLPIPVSKPEDLTGSDAGLLTKLATQTEPCRAAFDSPALPRDVQESGKNRTTGGATLEEQKRCSPKPQRSYL